MFPEKEKIELIVKRLQKIMKIEDWTINVECESSVAFSELYGNDSKYTRGDCNRDIHHNEALIRLNRDAEGEENWFYKTLVHELHHIITSRQHIYSQHAFNQIGNAQLLDYVNKVVGAEHENTTDYFAKIFIDLYPLEKCLKDIGIEI
jgi:hypothetical protein